MRRTLALLSTLCSVAAGLVLSAGVARADPSAAAWETLRQCESSGRYDINTGNGYFGAYQFNLATWRSVGGSGYPHEASPAEQDYRALYLYRMRGWQPWTCAAMRGLREDSDARSGVVPPYPGTTTPTTPTTPATPSGVPAYPGQLSEGDTSEALKLWQKQMATRGYPLSGTGFFGPRTKEVVLALQQASGLAVVGYIGPLTWEAAWTTTSTAPTAPSTPVPPTPTPNPAPSGCPVGATTAPDWPGITFVQGDSGADLACWQKQMGSRGYGLSGTGFYGQATKAVVLGVQQRNGLNQSGILGPMTWKAAWQGQ